MASNLTYSRSPKQIVTRIMLYVTRHGMVSVHGLITDIEKRLRASITLLSEENIFNTPKIISS